MDEFIFCRQCGQKNQGNNYQCTQCGFELHQPLRPCARVADDNTLGGLIPYKNAPALLAYYLGVFSMIPFFGFPLGIAAFILGIKGLKKAARHPEIQGKIHARVGIILGGLCTLLHALGIFVLITECL